jgi:hypothetical protein
MSLRNLIKYNFNDKSILSCQSFILQSIVKPLCNEHQRDPPKWVFCIDRTLTCIQCIISILRVWVRIGMEVRRS